MKQVTHVRKFVQYEPREITAKVVKAATIFVFDGFSIEDPELRSKRRNRVYVSDHHRGIVEWDKAKKQYVRHYYMTAREIGQLQHVLVEVA